jgi:hypothetical protein
MNRVRDQFRAGVDPNEAEVMRNTVSDTVRAVERICRQHHSTPQELPAPSRAAYTYLRELLESGALEDAPLPAKSSAELGDPPTPPGSAIEVTGIVSACNYYHREFSALVARSIAEKRPIDPDTVTCLANKLRTASEAIKALCEESDGTPADLPPPSKRGYGWLRYLSDHEILTRHLQTLKAFTLRARIWLAKVQPVTPDRTLQVQFSSASVLYRTRIKGSMYEITVNEGFIGAPRLVIDTLARAALDVKSADKRDSKVADAIRSYANGDAFAEVQRALQDAVDMPTYHAVGQYHDLNLAFERVNAAYFDGKLDRPHLQWNRTRTRRKYGHYDESRDTVMVSQTLDAAAVPDYVIDFIVYHELLHRTLGTPVVKGRRRVHTTAFRNAERDFRHYAEARSFLGKLSSHTKTEP